MDRTSAAKPPQPAAQEDTFFSQDNRQVEVGIGRAGENPEQNQAFLGSEGQRRGSDPMYYAFGGGPVIGGWLVHCRHPDGSISILANEPGTHGKPILLLRYEGTGPDWTF
jgi:hypothetical protein